MTGVIQQIVDGLANGAIYGLVAMALVLIFRSTGIINLAQGEMAMFATFGAWALVQAGLPIGIALPVAVVGSFVSGLLVERVIIRPVATSPELVIVMTTLGLFLVVNSLAGIIWGYDVHKTESVFGQRVFTVGGVTITADSIGVVVVLLLLAGGLALFFRRTRVGMAMRASTINAESAALAGISVATMRMLGWGLAAGLGAFAGIFTAPRLFLDPNMMQGVLVYAFAAATLGGFDSALGAVIGGLTLGVLENLIAIYVIPDQLRVLVPLVLLCIVLIVRPQGLFGRAKVVRV